MLRNYPKNLIGPRTIARTTHTSCYNGGSIKTYVEDQIKAVTEWFGSDRFQNIKRTYTPLDVVKHRGSINPCEVIYPSAFPSRKLFSLVEEHFKDKKPLHTLGVLDPVQMTQLSRCEDLKVAYVSGWACSSTMVGSTNDVSPDFGDYPYNTVPNQVERIMKAQQMHDRKAYLEKFMTDQKSSSNAEFIDYLKPIIADGDMGHGGPTTVMKVAKLFAEKGAAAVHLEDQLVGGKRCGHLSGAVLVPTGAHLSRLISTRFQWDIMGTENLILARTDSCNAKLISSDIDPRDHSFIQGILNPSKTDRWADKLLELERKEVDKSIIAEAEKEWYDQNKLYTYEEMIQIRFTESEYKDYLTRKDKYLQTQGKNFLSVREMKNIATEVNSTKRLEFCWMAPRTKEGYYMFKGGMEPAIRRSLVFAPYSDMIWLETKTPDLEQAKSFSKEIHNTYPHVKFVYNLSPSFNWTAHGFNGDKLKSFIWDLAKEGFVLQLVSLAGLHTNAASFWDLAKNFQKDGMKAYVDKVQKIEKQLDCDVLTHQKWSGAEYMDSLLNVVQNGSSSQTMSTSGESFTENQF
ncbi:Isocitrate lyase signature [Nakaseomyces glabratus]|nr:Isocitrate lyase signature [Nakaseomyces glabratus]KAH7595236.1 Isocitrate lyase signature [Nakaseomyces glabratus]KAH7611320.1 Isocitrate lyase signature [Nakaseomyces glabratus]